MQHVQRGLSIMNAIVSLFLSPIYIYVYYFPPLFCRYTFYYTLFWPFSRETCSWSNMSLEYDVLTSITRRIRLFMMLDAVLNATLRPPFVRRSDGSRLNYLARDGGEPPTYRPRPELGPSSMVSTYSHAACNPRTPLDLDDRGRLFCFLCQSRRCIESLIRKQSKKRLRDP